MPRCKSMRANVSTVISSLILLSIFYFSHYSVHAEEANVAENTTHDVTVGMFVTNLFDINFAKKEFKTEFWAWYLIHINESWLGGHATRLKIIGN